MPRFSSSKSFEQVKRARKLPERSHLAIEFPQSDGRVFRTYIPFLSNPKIQERGQANLSQYDLVGRPGSVFTYGGAKSRVVNLSFKINLLHTLYTHSTEGINPKFLRQFNLFFADKKRAEKAFKLKPGGVYDQELSSREIDSMFASLNQKAALDTYTQAIVDQQSDFDPRSTSFAGSYGPGGGAVPGLPVNPYSTESDRLRLEAEEEYDEAVAKLAKAKSLQKQLKDQALKDADETSNRDPDIEFGKGFAHAQTHRTFFREMVGQITGQEGQELPTPVLDGVANYFLEGIGSTTIPTPQQNIEKLNELIDATYVWVNLIRGSVLNNSTNTTQGPPIVRLQHGPMYNNVPFIVSDYSINIQDEVGYEVETLTPKGLEITMTLKEFRTNGSFEQSQIESGDHVCGWEAIIEGNNMDPYNGDIGEDVLGVQQGTLGTGKGDTYTEADVGRAGTRQSFSSKFFRDSAALAAAARIPRGD